MKAKIAAAVVAAAFLLTGAGLAYNVMNPPSVASADDLYDKLDPNVEWRPGEGIDIDPIGGLVPVGPGADLLNPDPVSGIVVPIVPVVPNIEPTEQEETNQPSMEVTTPEESEENKNASSDQNSPSIVVPDGSSIVDVMQAHPAPADSVVVVENESGEILGSYGPGRG